MFGSPLLLCIQCTLSFRPLLTLCWPRYFMACNALSSTTHLTFCSNCSQVAVSVLYMGVWLPTYSLGSSPSGGLSSYILLSSLVLFSALVCSRYWYIECTCYCSVTKTFRKQPIVLAWQHVECDNVTLWPWIHVTLSHVSFLCIKVFCDVCCRAWQFCLSPLSSFRSVVLSTSTPRISSIGMSSLTTS